MSPRPHSRVVAGDDGAAAFVLVVVREDVEVGNAAIGFSSAHHVLKALALGRAAELKRKVDELNEMRRSLEHLAARCHGDDHRECPILGALEGAAK